MQSELYVKLANISKDLLISRRGIEWKVCLAYWGGVVAMVAFLMTKGYNLEKLGWKYWALFVCLLAASLVFTYWHISINGSHRKDLDLILYFREKTERELGNNTLEPQRPDLTLPAFWYALEREGFFNCFLPHTIITILVFIVSMLALAF